ncbi:Golgi to ER traffic protein 4 like protein [Chelonia mydas]|uniref:Golgi to ER traffic protein 4 like protein n=1 Tax=Chelonia mydas TaxID=8469 RepID=M7B529_CHEMY|nr:Golgi to ER traffic protein 4 like protein [Chelonia mydas]
MPAPRTRQSPTWSNAELLDISSIWGEEAVHSQLRSSRRSYETYRQISQCMTKRGYDRDTLQCRVKVKEVRNAYHKAREANCCSGAVTTSCWLYKELDAILGGNPTSPAKATVDASVARMSVESGPSQEEEILDKDVMGDPEAEDNSEQNSAADLSMLVLESLEKSDAKVTDELLENLAKVFSLMDPNSPERVAFVSRALKWSSGGSGKLGHPKLHQLLAITLWKEQNYCESRYHFLHSMDGEGCANMLVEYSSSRGYRSEVDMFVAQAVLQFLCLKNKTSASVVFTTYTQKHPSIEKGPPFVQPLLNFIWFLLLAVDGGKLTVFTVLCEQYQPSLKRDPMYNEYLDRIGQLFFGVPPKQTSSYGGLLGNLLNSLMGAGEDDDAEDGQEDSSPIELD